MRIKIGMTNDISTFLAAELKKGERAVTTAMRLAGEFVRDGWREEIRSAGLGSRLPNSIKLEVYPHGDTSLSAAALIWSKAPNIISAHNDGTVIRAINRRFLAVPLPAAGKSARAGKVTPATWQQQHGIKLRLVPRRNGPHLLVADDARLNSTGRARRKGGRRRKDGILSGAQTVPIFLLIPQVRLRKRMDLARIVDRAHNLIPGNVLRNWDK